MRKNWEYFEKGEIATIVTIGTLIFLGVSTLTSSLLLKNKQTSSAKAGVDETVSKSKSISGKSPTPTTKSISSMLATLAPTKKPNSTVTPIKSVSSLIINTPTSGKVKIINCCTHICGAGGCKKNQMFGNKFTYTTSSSCEQLGFKKGESDCGTWERPGGWCSGETTYPECSQPSPTPTDSVEKFACCKISEKGKYGCTSDQNYVTWGGYYFDKCSKEGLKNCGELGYKYNYGYNGCFPQITSTPVNNSFTPTPTLAKNACCKITHGAVYGCKQGYITWGGYYPQECDDVGLSNCSTSFENYNGCVPVRGELEPILVKTSPSPVSVTSKVSPFPIESGSITQQPTSILSPSKAIIPTTDFISSQGQSNTTYQTVSEQTPVCSSSYIKGYVRIDIKKTGQVMYCNVKNYSL